MPKPRPVVLAARKQAYLDAFSLTGVMSHAAKAADVNRETVRNWRSSDPEFQAAFAEAEEKAADRLETEAFRRAHDGVERYVVSQGKVVIYEEKPLIERQYSDRLLEVLLGARKPERFRARSDVNVRSNIAVTFTEPGDKEL